MSGLDDFPPDLCVCMHPRSSHAPHGRCMAVIESPVYLDEVGRVYGGGIMPCHCANYDPWGEAGVAKESQ